MIKPSRLPRNFPASRRSATLRSGQDAASSLAEELEIVREDLALQKPHFGDNLEVREVISG